MAEPLRVATYTLEFSRKGPGLLLRDILKGDDPQILAAAKVIAEARADILLLIGMDYDLGNATLGAFASVIAAQGGHSYPYLFALRPNTGMATGFDLDRNGRLANARDAQGYGTYAGQSGLALLSRHPVDTSQVKDFSTFLWADLPDANLPAVNDTPYYSPEELGILRLSSTAHWDIPVDVPEIGRISLLAFAATPPLFDGAEDRNGLRNADEIRFWSLYLDNQLPVPPPDHPVIVLGKANLDPKDGDGVHSAIVDLLDHAQLQNPDSGKTAQFRAPPSGPGDLRVDYVLPDRRFEMMGSGVDWPEPENPRYEFIKLASRHRLVWVDLKRAPQ